MEFGDDNDNGKTAKKTQVRPLDHNTALMCTTYIVLIKAKYRHSQW